MLYDVDVLHHHPADRHVGAALELFASVAMIPYYILRIHAAPRVKLAARSRACAGRCRRAAATPGPFFATRLVRRP